MLWITNKALVLLAWALLNILTHINLAPILLSALHQNLTCNASSGKPKEQMGHVWSASDELFGAIQQRVLACISAQNRQMSVRSRCLPDSRMVCILHRDDELHMTIIANASIFTICWNACFGSAFVVLLKLKTRTCQLQIRITLQTISYKEIETDIRADILTKTSEIDMPSIVQAMFHNGDVHPVIRMRSQCLLKSLQ